MSDSPGSAPAPAAALDRDLYCLDCGYNLRGLYGDPVRCPECARLNPLGDAEIPAELITARLRKMETAPALCVGAAIFGIPFLILFGTLLIFGGLQKSHGEEMCCVDVPLLVLGGTWLVNVFAFRESCLAKPGWAGLLIRYHLRGLFAAAVVCAVVGGSAWFARWIGRSLTWELQTALSGAIALVVCVGLFIALRRWGRAWHARLTAEIRVMQREVAVTILREESRRRIERVGRSAPG